MPSLDLEQLRGAIAALHAAPQMVYTICTGAGAGVTNLLWSVPGCSRTLIASEFPYDGRAFAQIIGRVPAQYCSAEAAIALATAGYLKAQQCLVEAGKLATPIVGLGLTAAVTTDRLRRGDDRVFLAIRTADGLATVSAVFERAEVSREAEGETCDALGIDALLWAAGLAQAPIPTAYVRSDELTADGILRPKRVTLSLASTAFPLLIDEEGETCDASLLSPATHVLFPGSFNPLHFGHDQFARTVEAMTGKRVVFELAAVNADKPATDRDSLAARALQFRGRWPVLLSQDLPLFIHKARAYGGYDFVIGLDTAVRLFDPSYFAGEAERDAVVAEFRTLGSRFYVCNRGDDPNAFAAVIEDVRFSDLFLPLPMVVPVSSTDLRAAGRAI